jgi:ribosome maturation factor RimP
MSFLPENIEERMRDEIARRGMVLLDLKRRGERGSTVLEVIVDSEEGVKLDAITELSRWISALLDEAEELLPGRYKLEVSSAGLDRPLEHLWQYRKNVGRLLKVTFDDEEGTRKTELFRLVEVNEGSLLVELKALKAKVAPVPFAIPLDRVKRAVVEPQF